MCLKHQREVIEIIMSAPEYFYYALESRGWRCPLCELCLRAKGSAENIKALDRRASKLQFLPSPRWPEQLEPRAGGQTDRGMGEPCELEGPAEQG